MNFAFKSSIKPSGFLNSVKRVRQIQLRKAAERKFSVGDNVGGFAHLSKLTGCDDPAVLYRIGDCYERGLGAAQNLTDAVRWYEAAAKLDMVEAMVKLGDIYLAGRSSRDMRLRRAGQQGSGVAEAGHPWQKKASVTRDLARATYWNSRAAQAGSAKAQATLGFQYARALGVDLDVTEARKWFEASAEQGNVSGQLGLGLLFAGKALGEANTSTATFWFEKAVAQGNNEAKLALAQLLLGRNRPEAEGARAAELLLALATEGNTQVMFQLGEMYRLGRGVKQDIAAAETWLRRACSRDYLPAFIPLARLLSEQLSQPDYNYAAVILRKGAERGDVYCQLALGEFYAAGKGVPEDSKEAAAWLRRAALQGYISARAYGDRSAYGYSGARGQLDRQLSISADCVRLSLSMHGRAGPNRFLPADATWMGDFGFPTEL